MSEVEIRSCQFCQYGGLCYKHRIFIDAVDNCDRLRMASEYKGTYWENKAQGSIYEIYKTIAKACIDYLNIKEEEGK